MTIESGLYVVATPIGNLGDMTFRAVETLKACAVILCEDTRHTARLCKHFGISTPRERYDDHNGAKVRPGVLERLEAGAAMALVSDAGTPLVSDPGYKLVAEARDVGIQVRTVPGACAAIAALSISGLATDRFTFAGFPPSKTAARVRYFRDALTRGGTLIVYETAPRLAACLADLISLAPQAHIVVARELTKRHEEVLAGPAREIAETLAARGTLKGEIVLLIETPSAPGPAEGDLDRFLAQALDEGSVRDAADAAAAALGIARRTAYKRALQLAAQSTSPGED